MERGSVVLVVDPAVASLYDLRVPLNGAEFDVDALMSAVQDPV